jgi:quercetin dioxygenase-like cupin family protein
MSVSMGEEIRIGQMAVRFLVEGTESDGAVAIFEFDVPAGARVPVAHSHDGYEETVYGVRGSLTWTVEGVTTDVGPGQALLIPRGVVHNFANNQDGDATALAIVTPGVLGPEYFREIADAVSPGAPPDFAAIAAVMQKHGLTPAP